MIKLKKLSENQMLLEEFVQFEATAEKDRHSNLSGPLIKKLISFPLLLEKEAFLFYLEETLIARIFVHTDQDIHKGFFSLFACHKDLFEKHFQEIKEAFKEVEKWFYKRQIKEIIGPYFYSSFLPYRFRTDEGEDVYGWEPKQPFYEYQFFKELGFVDGEHYFSNFSDPIAVYEKNGKAEREKLLKEGFSFRYLDKKNLEEDIKEIYDLSMISFKNNYLFKPIPFEAFKELYIPGLAGYALDFTFFILSPEKKVAAFHFHFKDQNKLIFKSICVHPDFRGLGLLNAGIFESTMKVRKDFPEITIGVPALFHDKNAASKHVGIRETPKLLHTYKLVKKELLHD